MLSPEGAECYLNKAVTNHVMYAEDICFILSCFL